MAEPDFDHHLKVAHQAVDLAGQALRTRSPGSVTMKSDRNPATEVDYDIERSVREFLLGATPDISFLGEEDGIFGPDDELVWALDPVDGTVNFIHGIPLCGVSLGLFRNGEPVVGVIYLPFLGDRYHATLGGGSYRNGQRISVSAVRELSSAVVGLGDYAVGQGAPEKNVRRLAITERLVGKVQRLRMLGSAAIDLAWVADGQLDASVMLANKAWDTAAGVLVAREAGAVIMDANGNPHGRTANSTVAVNPSLAPALLAAITDPEGR